MTTNDLSAKVKEVCQSLTSLMQYVSLYEGQIENKEMELRSLQAKINAAREEHKASEGKASTMLGKASEDVAVMKNNARDMMAKAQEMVQKAVEDRALAEKMLAEARGRFAKLETDEKAFQANLIIWERKKSALESALKQ